MAKGFHGGFMCHMNSDIASASKLRALYSYCQTTDELIDAGWKIRVKADANSCVNVNVAIMSEAVKAI